MAQHSTKLYFFLNIELRTCENKTDKIQGNPVDRYLRRKSTMLNDLVLYEFDIINKQSEMDLNYFFSI